MESAAYQQTREAIERLRASIAALEERFEHFHASGSTEDLTRAQVKLQDLFAQLSMLQTCLSRFTDKKST
jgi:phage shock protein A